MPIYKIKQKLWSWGDAIEITNAEDENDFYIVKGEIIREGRSGIFIKTRFNISRIMGQVEKEIVFSKRDRDSPRIEVWGSNNFVITHLPFYDKCIVQREIISKSLAEYASNKWFSWRDSHVVRIDEGEDVGAILACCLIIDHWRILDTGIRPYWELLPNDALGTIMEFCGSEQFILLGLVNKQFCQAYEAKFAKETSLKNVVDSMQKVQWARANDCPWNEQLYFAMMASGHIDLLEWARENGCQWDESNVRAAIFKDNGFERLKMQAEWRGWSLGVVEKQCLQVLTTWCWFHDKDFADFERDVLRRDVYMEFEVD